MTTKNLINLTKYGVDWIHGDLIFSGISNQTLGVGKSDVRWSRTITLIVGDNLHFTMLKYSYTRVGCTQIDTNTGCFFGHDYKEVEI